MNNHNMLLLCIMSIFVNITPKLKPCCQIAFVHLCNPRVMEAFLDLKEKLGAKEKL